MTEPFGTGPLGLGSLSGMLDAMDMVKRAWSTFSLPASLTPTLDAEELERRIKDMKAVEQWLSMNLTMLQSTIQGMEVQHGTLVALKAFSESMTGSSDASNFAAQAMAAMQKQTRPEPATAKPAAAPPPSPDAAPASDARTPQESAAAAMADGLSRAAAAAVDPTAWWNLLQSQFQQVAQAAIQAGAGIPGTVRSDEAAPAAPSRKRASRSGTGKAAAPSAASRKRAQ